MLAPRTLVRHLSVVCRIKARRLRNKVLAKISRPLVFLGAKKIVTPFTPFLFSQHYLSFEIDEFGLNWLNPRSSNLVNKVEVLPGDIVYCRDDQLEEFCLKILPRIHEHFVLITGTGTPGGLPDDKWVKVILDSQFLLKWFAQNQIHPRLNIEIFPQGVDLMSTPGILLFMALSRFVVKKKGCPLVPFVTVHPHLVSPAREVREELVELMSKKRWLPSYLWTIARNRTVISPPGDRDDTFRHWECILLGSFPITNLSGNYQALFEDNMIYRADLVASASEIAQPHKLRPDSKIGTVAFWREKVEEARFL